MKSRAAIDILNKIANHAGNAVSFVAGLLAAVFLIFGGFALYDSLYIAQSAKSGLDGLQYRPAIIDDSTARLIPSELAAMNSDYRGWITVYDTNIDYPVMQGSDEMYYASHDIYKENSLSGSIYLSAGNSPDFSDAYNLLYGHHMDNGAMFGDLDKFVDKGFFDSHREAILVTETQVYDLSIFALIQTDAYEDAIYVVGNKDLSVVLAYAASHALQYDASVPIGSQIIALSTCTSATTSGRLALLATMTLRSGVAVDPTQPVNPENPNQTPGQVGPSGQEPDTKPNSGTPEADVPATPTTPTTPESPLEILEPRANDGKRGNWALLNLIAMLMTVYLALPLGGLKAKFKRLPKLRSITSALAADPAQCGLAPDEASAVARLAKRVTNKFRAGLVLEALIALASVIFFFMVTDFRQPLVIINRYTPPLLAMLAACLVVELTLIRFCPRKKPDEEGAAAE